MIKSKYRYQLYIKRAILQAHITAMDETIHQIENHYDKPTVSDNDYRLGDEDCFQKYLEMTRELD